MCAQRTSTEEWESLGNPSSSLLAKAGVEMKQPPMVSEKTSGEQLACHKVVHFPVGLLSFPAPWAQKRLPRFAFQVVPRF